MPGGSLRKLLAREDRRIAEKLERLSRDYGLASRAMALVAVLERARDDASQVPTTRVVPVGMPEDTHFAAYFGAAGFVGQIGLYDALVRHRDVTRGGSARESLLCYPSAKMVASEAAGIGTSVEDRLLSWAVQLLPDGGLPGENDESRWRRSALLLAAFLASGSTANRGPFRLHVQKLVTFLKSGTPPVAPGAGRELVERILACAEGGGLLKTESPERLLHLLASLSKSSEKAWKRMEREFAKLL